MSEVVDELARVRVAFAQPTLTLLHQRQAPVVIAVFRSAFGRENRPMAVGRLHAQVEDHLEQLRRAGEPDVPTGTGRELCLRWMRGQWLVRSLDDAGHEVYTLTSHAQQALELVKALSRDRATLSEHRVATLLAAVRRFNSEANPDRGARVEMLNAEVARLTAERDRLVDGGEIEPPSPDYMLEGFTELQSLISALPSDFARVEERFAAIRAEILAAFRAEDRPAGEVIDAYLARADALMTATPEGRAFEGAFTLLRDDEMLARLRDDLADLLDHPLADGLLADPERSELRGTVRLIREGLERVLVQRSRVTSTLKEYIVSHDAARDRELERTLRQVESELTTWFATTGPRAAVDLPLLPPRVEVEHLRERFHDPADDRGPERLADAPRADDEPPAYADLLAQGGPSLSVLRGRLTDALAGAPPADGSGDRPTTLGDLFAGLDAPLRRPVEVLGLLHLAADHDLAAEVDLEHFRTVRSDGSERTFAVPRVPLTSGAGRPGATPVREPVEDER